jgi:hypothetical protein
VLNIEIKLSLYTWANSPRYIIYRRFSMPHRWCGCGGKEKNLYSYQELNPDCPVHSQSLY